MEKIKNIKITDVGTQGNIYVTAEFCGKKIYTYTDDRNLLYDLKEWFKLAESGNYALLKGVYTEDIYLITKSRDDWYVATLLANPMYEKVIIKQNGGIKLFLNKNTDIYYIDREYGKKFNIATK